jgi:long-chain acyl-CoA synthetase
MTLTPPLWIKSYPPNIRWDAEIPIHPLFSLLDKAEDAYGDKLAIDFLGAHTTYAELADQVRRVACGLRALGVKKGVRVGLFLPNCPQFVISYYAILKAGGTVVNYNPLYSPDELRHQIDDSATEIMITLALKMLYPKVASCLGTTKLQKIIVSEFQEALPFVKRMAFPYARKADIAEYPDDARHVRFTALMEAAPDIVRLNIDPKNDVALLQYTGNGRAQRRGADPCQSLCQRGAMRVVVYRFETRRRIHHWGTAVVPCVCNGNGDESCHSYRFGDALAPQIRYEGDIVRYSLQAPDASARRADDVCGHQ